MATRKGSKVANVIHDWNLLLFFIGSFRLTLLTEETVPKEKMLYNYVKPIRKKIVKCHSKSRPSK